MAPKRCFILTLSYFVLCLATIHALEFDVYRHLEVPQKYTDDPSDSVLLYKYMNAEYYSVIRVGHPSKIFKVTFDTTWGDSWLPSQHCGFTQVACMMHNRYDSSKSSTYQADGRIYHRANSEVSLTGFLSMDNIHLDHTEVWNQTFVEMTKMSNFPFMMSYADGIIGLGFISLSVPGTLPFFYNLVKQGAIKEQVFTFYMNRDATTEKAGKLLLGATDRAHAKGNLTYVPLIEKKYWTVHMDGVMIDSPDNSYRFCVNGCTATFDTSTNQIIGPATEIAKINYALHAKEISPTWPYRYMVDCREFAKLPDVHFVLSGTNHTIESKYYVQHLTYFGFTMCLSPFTASNDNSWTLGGAFLMQFYSEFDFQNGRVGIAETIF